MGLTSVDQLGSLERAHIDSAAAGLSVFGKKALLKRYEELLVDIAVPVSFRELRSSAHNLTFLSPPLGTAASAPSTCRAGEFSVLVTRML